MVGTVAKAATKAGEFFCFHCGKQVAQEEYDCRGCGSRFDRIVRAFRCPRCARILPVGAVVCPACGLGFKIRNVGGTKLLTKDEELLVELIDRGKQPDAPIPEPQPSVPTTQPRKAPKPHQRPDDSLSITDLSSTPDAHYSLNPATTDTMKGQADQMAHKNGRLSDVGMRVEGDAHLSHPQTPQQERIPLQQESGRGSLSNQALKRLLEERERELLALKSREEEIARREEHIERRMREYASRRREFDALGKQGMSVEKGATHGGAMGGHDDALTMPGHLLVDDKDGWLREQSKIKMDLIEIRNEMGAREEPMDYYPPHVSEDILQKIEAMEERLMDASREREELSAKVKKLEAHIDDAKELLKILDQLLGRLPPEVINEFSKSKDFELYEKVLDQLRI